MASSRRYQTGGVFIPFLVIFLSSCTGLLGANLPTPIPTEYIPTVIALTIEAGKATNVTASATVAASDYTATSTGEVPATDAPAPTATRTETVLSETPKLSPTSLMSFTPTIASSESISTAVAPHPSATSTPIQAIPNAEIEIYNLGPLSKVTSPLNISAYLKPGIGGRVRIELIGEDNRILTRQITSFPYANPGARVYLKMELVFEILAIAEAGRLQFSVEDEFGRMRAFNSVPLILLSIGEPDILPPIDQLDPIYIKEPTRKAFIQGGTVFVSGLARPASDQPLVAQLITTKGKFVGTCACLVPVSPTKGSHGTFAIEMPYTVTGPTPVLLVVWEGGSSNSDLIHLSSVEIMLSP